MAIAVTITVIILNTVTLFMIVSALRLLSSSRVLWSSSSSCLSSSSLSSSPPDRLPCRFLHCREIQHQNTTAIFSILTDTTLTIHVRLVCIKVVDIIIAWSLTALSWSHAYHHYLCSQHHGKYRHHDHHQQPPPPHHHLHLQHHQHYNPPHRLQSGCDNLIVRLLVTSKVEPSVSIFFGKVINKACCELCQRTDARDQLGLAQMKIILGRKPILPHHPNHLPSFGHPQPALWRSGYLQIWHFRITCATVLNQGYLASTFVLELEKKRV